MLSTQMSTSRGLRSRPGPRDNPHVTRRSRLTLVSAFVAAALSAGAAGAESGFYVRMDLGAHAGPNVLLKVGDNDRPSRCDGFVNPEYAALPGCTDPDRSIDAVDQWSSRFNGASGLFAGAAVGYRFSPRLRMEAEYFHRHAAFDESSDIVAPSGVPYVDIFGPELPRAEERLGSIRAHNAFVNLIVDFPLGRVTPYLGVGAGAADMSLDYNSYWARANDPALMGTAASLPNEEEVRRNLAGTVTLAQSSLRDRLSGYQVLIGLAVALNDSVALDAKARWARFSELEDGGSYRRLRSHDSNLRLDGSEPVVYRAGTADTGFFAVTVGLRYGF